MSKLSFRARALDASKPMPIFMAEELPDLPDYSAINRAVPQMPSGMQKEEECEHHLQRAIVAGLIIPTPEVTDVPSQEFYDNVYPANYKQPRQLIHMQPFTMEQDIPDYDMDSDDERWLQSQTQKLELSPLKFEEMMDRLEKSSSQTVVTLNEAKALLKEDDDLITAVFDYWLYKRLKTQHPLILTVKTEHRAGQAANNPYLAFRRRTEKMQTRKNRKNDEASYEKMLKLRRDIYRAVTLLELVKRREKMKREFLNLTVEVFEKRYQARDFSGAIIAEASALKSTRPAFTPIFHNHYTNQSWANKAILKDEIIPRREKRQYKKRKHKSLAHQGRSGAGLSGVGGQDLAALSSDEEGMMPQLSPEPEEQEDEGQFAFRRNKQCSYHMPLPYEGNWPWHSKEEHGMADKKFRFTLTSVSHPRQRCVGFARRRVGRGGRIILDRVATDYDDFWRTLDFSIIEPKMDNDDINKPINISFPENSDHKLVDSNEDKLSEKALVAVSDSCIYDNVYDALWTGDSVKNELSLNNGSSLRTSVSDGDGVKLEQIKKERVEVGEEDDGKVQANPDSNVSEIVEYLRSISTNWLHFRPKTPPPDYDPPCYLLPADDSIFTPSANQPFSMEILPTEPPSSLVDTSSFLTDPFTINEVDLNVPITDTRQLPHSSSDKHVQTGPNTLNKNNSVKNSVNCKNGSVNNCVNLNDSVLLATAIDEVERTAGCSSFMVVENEGESDCSATVAADFSESVASLSPTTSGSPSCTASKLHTSTLTSPKLNNSNVSERRPRGGDSYGGSTNGLLTQFGFDVPTSRTRNNKLYAYSGGVDFSNASQLNLHTAHTLTLNSHSANILEIPITNDPDNKLVNSQCTEGATNAANNKKTIVRKNNLIMEVT